jgi:GNAT superfamily N-acetyltransferase
MPSPVLDRVELGPDDALFRAWCEVWAAGQRLDRRDESPRPASEHVALARQLVTPGGSRDGTHRAAVVDGVVVGALRLLLPMKDNPTVAIVDVAVHPDSRRRGIGGAQLERLLALERQRIDRDHSRRAGLPSSLDGVYPDAAGADDHDGVSGSHLCGIGCRTPSCRDTTPHRSCLVQRQALVDPDHGVLVEGGALAERAEQAQGAVVLDRAGSGEGEVPTRQVALVGECSHVTEDCCPVEHHPQVPHLAMNEPTK